TVRGGSGALRRTRTRLPEAPGVAGQPGEAWRSLRHPLGARGRARRRLRRRSGAFPLARRTLLEPFGILPNAWRSLLGPAGETPNGLSGGRERCAMLHRVEIFVYSRAAIERVPPHDVPHIVISITTTEDDRARIPSSPHCKGVLRLVFHDADAPTATSSEEALFSAAH